MTESTLETEPQIELADAPVPPTLIDTHAHIHFDAFAGQVDGVLQHAREAGVGKIVTVGVNTADSLKAAQMAATYEPVWASVGIHPHEAEEAEQGLGYLRDLASRRKVVAIGECGLDYYKSTSSADLQEKALRQQIELAGELDLPVNTVKFGNVFADDVDVRRPPLTLPANTATPTPLGLTGSEIIATKKEAERPLF